MKKEPLVSVIVPVFNITAYIESCVESIIHQTYRNLEIIIVDDGSTDGSSAVCDQLKAIDKRIVLYHNTNGGLSYARNFGIEKSKGEILAFVDGDDLLHPKAIEILVNNMACYNADISEGGVIREGDTPYKEFVHTRYKNQHKCFDKKQALIEMYAFSEYLHIMAWAKIYKRELFSEVRFPEGMLHEDMAVMYKLYGQANRIIGSLTPVYYVREREGSITRSKYNVFRMDCWYRYYSEPLDFFQNVDIQVYNAICAGYLKSAIPYYGKAYKAQDKLTMSKIFAQYKLCFAIKTLRILRKKLCIKCVLFRLMPNAFIELMHY